MLTWIVAVGFALVIFFIYQLSLQIRDLQRLIHAIQKDNKDLLTHVGSKLLLAPIVEALERTLWKIGFEEPQYNSAIRQAAERNAESAFKLAADEGRDGTGAAVNAYMKTAGASKHEDAKAYVEGLKGTPK